jgi:hypothetical protein
MIKAMSLGAVSFLAAAAFATPAQAQLLGQTFDYCTNSVYSGTVTLDPSACDDSVVFTRGSATVIDPGVEVNLVGTGTRTVDFNNTGFLVTYDGVSSPSEDLFVFTGFEGITSLTLVSADPLDITTVFNSTAIGILINSPLENGVVSFRVLVNAIPEPATWAMMIGGFGLAGAALRRRAARPALA